MARCCNFHNSSGSSSSNSYNSRCAYALGMILSALKITMREITRTRPSARPLVRLSNKPIFNSHYHVCVLSLRDFLHTAGDAASAVNFTSDKPIYLRIHWGNLHALIVRRYWDRFHFYFFFVLFIFFLCLRMNATKYLVSNYHRRHTVGSGDEKDRWETDILNKHRTFIIGVIVSIQFDYILRYTFVFITTWNDGWWKF